MIVYGRYLQLLFPLELHWLHVSAGEIEKDISFIMLMIIFLDFYFLQDLLELPYHVPDTVWSGCWMRDGCALVSPSSLNTDPTLPYNMCLVSIFVCIRCESSPYMIVGEFQSFYC